MKMEISLVNGELFLLSEKVDFKIDTNRKVYIKNNLEESYTFSEIVLPTGMKRHEKIQYLVELRYQMEDSLNRSAQPLNEEIEEDGEIQEVPEEE